MRSIKPWFLKMAIATLLCALTVPAMAQTTGLVTVLREAVLTIETGAVEKRLEKQNLPFKWDTYLPGQNGRVRYELLLPPSAGYARQSPQDLFALYAPRAGNQVQVFVNDQLVADFADAEDTRRDGSQMPLYVPIPARLLHEHQPNQLVFKTTVQSLRWGGLSEVYFGLDRALCHTYDWARLWQKTSYVAIVVALLLMGLLSFMIWQRQRRYEPAKLYLYFVWSAISGSIAAIDHLFTQHLIPWPLQGIIVAVALAWHVIFMARFALEVAGRREHWVSLSMLASILAIGIAYVLAQPVYWTLLFGLLCLPLLAALVCTAKAADHERSGQARLLFGVSLIAALAALRDFFWVQWPDSGMSHFVLLPHALFLFIVVMGWILIQRYTQQYRLHHDLNIHLEARVSEREQQLAQSFEALQKQGQERAKLLERQRIMSDIHDGVGGQLVGLLNLIKRGRKKHESPDAQDTNFAQSQLEEHAQMALDELRVAVDAMQPVDGDLGTVLATLRYRLEPRLKAQNIELGWQIEELPLMVDLSPQKVLQIQKILLETFTNIMRHSHASHVVVSAKAQALADQALASCIVLTINDNGVGFDEAQLQSQGHGLGNMRFRAVAIGAQLSIASGVTRGLPRGTSVTLEIPI